MKILILKPSSLGDIVQALPVLRLLKLHYRNAEIFWWVETRNAALLEGDPDLAGIFHFDRKRWALPRHWGDIWKAVHELRRHQFDLVLDLQSLARSGVIGWLANGKLFVGLHDWRELAPGYYDIDVPRPTPNAHAVDWYLETLRALHVPVHFDFEWIPRRDQVAQEVATRWRLNNDAPVIALLPGARWENKRWPAQYFRELVTRLERENSNLRFVILGNKADVPLASEIAAGSERCLDLTTKTSLPQTIEVLRACRVVVTNDTGPMHMAAALRKPVIGIFGPTNPRRTGPYGQIDRALQRQDIPCIPCMKPYCTYREPLACLRGIFPVRIAEEVLARLEYPHRDASIERG